MALSQMLKRVLSLPDCQIARLGLVGNAVGDQGLAELCSSLKVRVYQLLHIT